MITREIVIRNGQPVWRVTCEGMAVESPSGTQANAIIEAFALSHGLTPTAQRIAPAYVADEHDGPFGEPGT